MKLYKAISNEQGDDWGVYEDIEAKKPWVLTKQGWIDRLNEYQEMDGEDYRYTLADWDTLNVNLDCRGIVLADADTGELANTTTFKEAWTGKREEVQA